MYFLRFSDEDVLTTHEGSTNVIPKKLKPNLWHLFFSGNYRIVEIIYYFALASTKCNSIIQSFANNMDYIAT